MWTRDRSPDLAESDDLILHHAPPDAPDGYFDRFYFNLHGPELPMLLIGGGVYPNRDLVDGYVVVVDGTGQRNLRMSTDLDPGEPQRLGAMRWEVLAPYEAWRLTLDDSPIGIRFDLTWQARTPPWMCQPIRLGADATHDSNFSHFFQSGCYTGTLTIDGTTYDVSGWWGQRDRSRGTRPAALRQGLHLWVQAQFADHCVGVMADFDRDGRPALVDGAVMHTDGRLDPIIEVQHDLSFDTDLDTAGGRLLIATRSGRRRVIDVDAGQFPGGYMAGAGYGGWHGVPRGPGYHEAEMWAHSSVNPSSLGSSMVDRLSRYVAHGESPVDGTGVFEFAHTRSSSFRYRPTLDPTLMAAGS